MRLGGLCVRHSVILLPFFATRHPNPPPSPFRSLAELVILSSMPADAASDLPPVDDWRTTDQDEITRRRLRAREEAPLVVNRDARFPIFSDFEVHSQS